MIEFINLNQDEPYRYFKEKYDYVVELPATAPLRDYRDIDKAINKLIKKKSDSVIGVSRVLDKHPIRIKKIFANFSKSTVNMVSWILFTVFFLSKAYSTKCFIFIFFTYNFFFFKNKRRIRKYKNYFFIYF